MINLLPTETRKSLLYARRNTYLRKWVVALVVIISVLVLVTGVGLLYLKKTTDAVWKQVDQDKASLQAQDQAAVKAEVEDLTSSLKLVDQVLSKEVLFSQLLKQIGAVMPAGAVLTNLSINELEGGIDLLAASTTYQNGTQVHINLSDPQNKIFSSVDLVNIQCESTTVEFYPCKITIRALFAKENPFLFINKDAEATP